MRPLAGIPIVPPHQDAAITEEYARMQEDAPIVEHLTIPGFLNRIPYRWTLDDIARFGGKVGRAAETIHLAYMPQIDRSLGVLRSFPVPMLKRIYDLMAPTHRWPQVIELPEAPEKRQQAREAVPTTTAARLKLVQGVASYLRAMAADSQESEVRVAARVLVEAVDADCKALERELEIGQVREMSTPAA